MSGYSYEETCPNCKQEMTAYQDTRSPGYGAECYHCGYAAVVEETQLSLAILNQQRHHNDLPALAELPEWKLDPPEPDLVPELRQALQELADWVEKVITWNTTFQWPDDMPKNNPYLKRARAAIAKAKGEA